MCRRPGGPVVAAIELQTVRGGAARASPVAWPHLISSRAPPVAAAASRRVVLRGLTATASALALCDCAGMAAAPAQRRAKGKKPQCRPEPTTDEEIRQRQPGAHHAQPDFRALVRTRLKTGCRYGELIRLEVCDSNPDAATPAIRRSSPYRRCRLRIWGQEFESLRARQNRLETLDMIFRSGASPAIFFRVRVMSGNSTGSQRCRGTSPRHRVGRANQLDAFASWCAAARLSCPLTAKTGVRVP